MVKKEKKKMAIAAEGMQAQPFQVSPRPSPAFVIASEFVVGE